MKYIAIGDIHGHHDQLTSLMAKLEKRVDFKKDILVFLGDFVDGGFETKKVLDDLVAWKAKYPHWQFLYGNHEDLMLDALNPKHPIYGDFYLWWNQGGKETTLSYTRGQGLSAYELSLVQPEDVIPPEHFEFMLNLDTWFETDDYFFVHGGVHPHKTIEWAKKNWNRYDFIWQRDFIDSNMKWEKKIIFGHTVRTSKNPKNHLTPWVMENKIGIDTMMHNIGKLTAVILPEEKFVKSSS